jgi:hypothetical protein
VAKVHGKSTYVAFGTAASEVNISTYCDTAEIDQAIDEVEVTGFTATGKEYVLGFADNSFSVGGPWDATLHATLQPLNGVVGKSLIFGPAGNTAGLVKLSATAMLKNYKISSGIGGAVTWSGEIRISGGVTDGTF